MTPRSPEEVSAALREELEAIKSPYPEPCLKGRCWSPMACNAFGYCRERNFAADGDPGPSGVFTMDDYRRASR